MIKVEKQSVFRGEVWLVDFGEEGVGSEQKGRRPAVIIQNNIGNKHSPTIIVALITGQEKANHLPTHMPVKLVKPSVIMCEQIKTIDKSRLLKFMYSLNRTELDTLKFKLSMSMCID